MTQKLTKFTILVIVLLFIGGAQLLAQTGTIRGTLYDTDRVNTLIGTNVFLKDDPVKGEATDFDGKYILANAAAGTHTLMFSYTGYETQEQQVIVQNGSIALDYKLGQNIFSLSPLDI